MADHAKCLTAEQMAAYRGKALKTMAEYAAVEEHLAECASCREQYLPVSPSSDIEKMLHGSFHPDAFTLARHLLLKPDVTAEARRHIDGCPHCQQKLLYLQAAHKPNTHSAVPQTPSGTVPFVPKQWTWKKAAGFACVGILAGGVCVWLAFQNPLERINQQRLDALAESDRLRTQLAASPSDAKWADLRSQRDAAKREAQNSKREREELTQKNEKLNSQIAALTKENAGQRSTAAQQQVEAWHAMEAAQLESDPHKAALKLNRALALWEGLHDRRRQAAVWLAKAQLADRRNHTGEQIHAVRQTYQCVNPNDKNLRAYVAQQLPKTPQLASLHSETPGQTRSRTTLLSPQMTLLLDPRPTLRWNVPAARQVRLHLAVNGKPRPALDVTSKSTWTPADGEAFEPGKVTWFLEWQTRPDSPPQHSEEGRFEVLSAQTVWELQRASQPYRAQPILLALYWWQVGALDEAEAMLQKTSEQGQPRPLRSEASRLLAELRFYRTTLEQ